MEIFNGQNILYFEKVFSYDEARVAYLADLKWHNGFTSKKRGQTSGL